MVAGDSGYVKLDPYPDLQPGSTAAAASPATPTNTKVSDKQPSVRSTGVGDGGTPPLPPPPQQPSRTKVTPQKIAATTPSQSPSPSAPRLSGAGAVARSSGRKGYTEEEFDLLMAQTPARPGDVVPVTTSLMNAAAGMGLKKNTCSLS